MEAKTVLEMKALARDRGLKRYSALRKAELIDLLRTPTPAPRRQVQPVPAPRQGAPTPVPRRQVQPVPAPRRQVQPTPAPQRQPPTPAPRQGPIPVPRRRTSRNILDEPVHDSTAALVPTSSFPARVISSTVDFAKEKVSQAIETGKRLYNSWMSYIKSFTPKVLDQTLDSFTKKIKDLYKTSPFIQVTEERSALREFVIQYTIQGLPQVDPTTFLNQVKSKVLELIASKGSSKVKLVLNLELTKEGTDETFAFNSDKQETSHPGSDNDLLYDEMSERVLENLDSFNERGSAWIFKEVKSLVLHLIEYTPLAASSYFELHDVLAKKKAIINLKNEDDNECFKWCVTRALNPIKTHPERITKTLIEQSKDLNWDGLTFPLEVKRITAFERLNPGLSVNVYEYASSKVNVIRASKVENPSHEIDLLYLTKEDSEQTLTHYALINDLSRLLASQITKHKGKVFLCRRCLNSFNSEESLANHKILCNNHKAVRIEMPPEGSTLKFKDHYMSAKVPFTAYTDFECFTKPIDTSQPNPERSSTTAYQKHTPSGYSYTIKCFDDDVMEPLTRSYTMQEEGEDVAKLFVEQLEEDVKMITRTYGKKEMLITAEEEKTFKESTHCYMCDGPFEDTKNLRPVRDHDHYNGKYRGAAHSICNLKARETQFLPVFFHNLSGYDSHLFIRNLGKTDGPISCIPNNEERFISFSKTINLKTYTDKKGKERTLTHTLRFLDSAKFLPASLDSLSANLEKDQFKNLENAFEGESRELLKRKGVYPYDYMDSFERLSETQLPPKESFYSRLNDSHISDEDYAHARKVWKAFGCQTMRDYHDLYLKTDVMLLADVFETFRDMSMTNYGLDPCWCYTLPGLSWQAMLKITKVELELLSDPDMLLMFEQGVRGGVSSIMHRYSKANNKYQGADFNPNEPSRYLQYLDANNLYGWSMSQPLPCGGFKWMDENELESWYDRTCILEVDLEYPTSLHEKHNEYPLAPERLTINKVEKLIPNLNNKVRYVLHHKNLKQYLSLGLKLTKIHRGIRFEERPWLKDYIDLNTSLRAKATNNFEKDFFKLMNNSVFGKTMENIRNRVNIELVNDRARAKKLAAKPNFEHCTIVDEDLVALNMNKTKIKFDKPVYVGMAILDLSKTLMYDFHYAYMKQKYGERAKLLFTDTDSLCYQIQTDDFYNDISPDVQRLFDTSNYPIDHPSGIPTGLNKKVLGMFKDECSGQVMTEFVGLRAKLYAYKMHEGAEGKRCKGIRQGVVKNKISIEDYKECLFSGKVQHRVMNVIRSRNHNITTETVNKIALSANDDKRVILEDGVHTRAIGHWRNAS